MPELILPALIMIGSWIVFFIIRRKIKDSPILVRLAVRLVLIVVDVIVAFFVAYLILRQQFPSLEFWDIFRMLSPDFWAGMEAS